MTDQYTGVFDDIDPDDFSRGAKARTATTTAIYEEHHSPDGLQGFIDNQVRSVRYAYAASDGDMCPLVVLASARAERLFEANDGESWGEFYKRMASEAREMAANRAFLVLKTMAHVLGYSEDEAPPSTQEEINKAVTERAGQLSVYWYAQEVDWVNQTHVRINGILPIQEHGGGLGEVVSMPVPDGVGMHPDVILGFNTRQV